MTQDLLESWAGEPRLTTQAPSSMPVGGVGRFSSHASASSYLVTGELIEGARAGGRLQLQLLAVALGAWSAFSP